MKDNSSRFEKGHLPVTKGKSCKITKNCKGCGKSFEVYPSAVGNYCSRKCQVEMLSIKNTGNKYREGGTPWNKGKTLHYEVWNKGKHPEYVQGENHPMFGKHHTEETKKKLAIETAKRFGEKCGAWKGGISRIYRDGYYSREYKAWRKSVFERDNYTCMECGIRGNTSYITAHHIKSQSKYPELIFEISNGKTLCEICHSKTDNYKGRARRKIIKP